MSENKQFEFGQTVKDFTTGFTGMVVGKAEYMDGNIRMGVYGKCTDASKQADIEWILPYYLELVDENILGSGNKENHSKTPETKQEIINQISALTGFLKVLLEYVGVSCPTVNQVKTKINDLVAKL